MRPKPVDTRGVELTDDLLELSETMARHVHEVWARSRKEQGWTLGPERNDRLKQTPCLVDYDDLTEEEREYDRLTSQETLKLLLSLGYRIEKPTAASPCRL